MDEDTPATPQPTTAKAGPPRGLILAAVALLIIVAIAGIVLARKNSGSKAPIETQATAPAPAPAEVASAVSTPEAPYVLTSGPNEVVFEIGLAKLLTEGSESIVKFSDSARGAPGMVRMTARYPAGPNKDKDLALAKERAAAVRHALESNGIKSERVQTEMIEMPAGTVSRREAGRVELSLH